MDRKPKHKEPLSSCEDESLEDSREWWIEADQKEEQGSSQELISSNDDDHVRTMPAHQDSVIVRCDQDRKRRNRMGNDRQFTRVPDIVLIEG